MVKETNVIIIKNKNLKTKVMETVKRKCDVVMLATKNKSSIRKTNTTEKLYEDTVKFHYGDYLNQHLYILSSEEIKEGDWFYDSALNKISQATKKDDINWFNELNPEGIKVCKKIIATTNNNISLNLGKEYHESPVQGGQLYTRLKPYPQPSPQFIAKFIESYNKGIPIVEILVEYEEFVSIPIEHLLTGSDVEIECRKHPVLMPKVDKNNTITISKVKESWSREEVKNLIREYANQWCSLFNEQEKEREIENWVEQNL